ncbi:hypothetical protein M728_004642 (plasmid) [Ensifer sp. WSM1721]|uniref:hypothetical protein n=1 Tax=Ensifer sp. WSM1721 TaxID=1041159 RepID=UPI00047D218B|nr:hypothetical protein [Ensifer sp. WSM1721]
MPISRIIGRGLLALALAGAPLASIAPALSDVAFAKGGNGGGNAGGGSGGGGGGHGNGHSKARSETGKSGGSRAGASRFNGGHATQGRKSGKAAGKSAKVKTATAVPTPKPKSAAAESAKLRSLGRNFHAYINSNDPRMAAISAYVIAYATFEAENGPDAIPTDPALSDEALRDAIASFTNEDEVTDDTLADVKETLGVGPAVGKIDQVRDYLQTTSDEDIVN